MSDQITKKSDIVITVGLDANQIPSAIKWSAVDTNVTDAAASAFLLSIWDPKEKNTMKIDLWTKDMSIEEMKQFFHQTLLSMSDTFYAATNDEKMTATMRDFCAYFAEKLEIIKK